MHPVVLDKPYEFVPPYHGRFWPWLLQKFVRYELRKRYGIEQVRCEGIERIHASMRAGDSVLLAPNHCRPCDPMVVLEVCRLAGVRPFTMASWHVFMQGRVGRWLLRRVGGFSVYREGMDRQSLDAAVDILCQAKRPLVVFPEGVITRTNDRLISLMEGVTFIARTAAKKRATKKQSDTPKPGGNVVIHPVALRYRFHGDIDSAVSETLSSIESRLSWRPIRGMSSMDRIVRVGKALLWLKEIEYFGEPQTGEIGPRTQRLIDQILSPMEQEWRGGRTEATTVARVKQLRMAILPEMIADTISAEEKQRRWDQLADMYIAQQIGHYPPDYVRGDPTPERMLETIERFEEDLTDVARIHRPMSVDVKIGEPIVVSPKRIRGLAEDPTLSALNQQLHQLLGIGGAIAAKEDVEATADDACKTPEESDPDSTTYSSGDAS